MSLFNFFNTAKDYLLAGAVKLWFNQNLKRYGQMTQIRIDSQNHRIDVELELKGETSPIQVAIKSYELSSEAGETFIAIGEIETSREWINQLISDYLPPDKKRFKVVGVVGVVGESQSWRSTCTVFVRAHGAACGSALPHTKPMNTHRARLGINELERELLTNARTPDISFCGILPCLCPCLAC